MKRSTISSRPLLSGCSRVVSSLMWVRALVGPRPVCSRVRRTTALEIAAAIVPRSLLRSSVVAMPGPLSVSILGVERRKAEDERENLTATTPSLAVGWLQAPYQRQADGDAVHAGGDELDRAGTKASLQRRRPPFGRPLIAVFRGQNRLKPGWIAAKEVAGSTG